MKHKIFLPLLLLITLSMSSCVYADISPDVIKSDPNFAPFIERTKLEGVKLLPGRYVQAASMPTRYRGRQSSMLAPSFLVMTIDALKTSYNNLPSYSATLDMYENSIVTFIMTLDTQKEVPVLKTYVLKKDGLSKAAEDYVVFADWNENYMLVESRVSDNLKRILFPFNDKTFPENWYKGSWLDDNAPDSESEDIKITFDDDKKFYINDEFLGLYSVNLNRIALCFTTGRRGTIYALYDRKFDSLIMNFSGVIEKLNGTAGVFKRVK